MEQLSNKRVRSLFLILFLKSIRLFLTLSLDVNLDHKCGPNYLTECFPYCTEFKDFNNALLLLKQVYSVCAKSILKNSSRCSENVKMLRLALCTELGWCWTENYLFSLFCMKNTLVWKTPSSRFAVEDHKVPISRWGTGANPNPVTNKKRSKLLASVRRN